MIGLMSWNPLGRPPKPRRRAISAGPVDIEDRIVGDVLCIECGTSLQGQSVRQPCAACGHSNSDSVYGDFLIYSGPAILKRLDEAATVVISVAAFTGLLGVVVIAGMLLGAQGSLDAID